MNTDQLYDLIWGDTIVSSHIMAVVSCNALKHIKEPRGCYIVNTNQYSYSRGDTGHWIFLRIHSNGATGINGSDKAVKCSTSVQSSSVEIFDALGPQIYNEDMQNFIKQFKSYSINRDYICKSKCGFYSLVYAYYKCRGFSSTCILNIIKGVKDIEKSCMQLYGSGAYII